MSPLRYLLQSEEPVWNDLHFMGDLHVHEHISQVPGVGLRSTRHIRQREREILALVLAFMKRRGKLITGLDIEHAGFLWRYRILNGLSTAY